MIERMRHVEAYWRYPQFGMPFAARQLPLAERMTPLRRQAEDALLHRLPIALYIAGFFAVGGSIPFKRM
jgi:hypothetical protein